MIFKKDKPPEKTATPSHAPRGRGTSPGANPLARRFADEGEPDTIDLHGPAGFPDDQGHDPGDDEPDTRVASAAPAAAPSKTWAGIVSHDAETGKFYALPGSAEAPVTLDGEPITAPTELRRGDRIVIGAAEFEFLS
ncbi:MAG: hypothetical protein KJN78_05860 [Gammaproteobacteria bacterium]|nr:hypothetical protein [Gammaproteobacteria bacterium]NNJ79766.1 hypothetical protein [Xanthomonadales bacterium]